MTSTEQQGALRAERRASRHRVTKETNVSVELNLDGSGEVAIDTGIPFFDHMLTQLARHSGMDLFLKTSGDLEVDAHHSVEDTGIALGEALSEALSDKAGVRRFSSVALPLDEALVEVALDLSGRPYLRYEVDFGGHANPIGTPGFDPQLAEEFFRAFVMAAKMTLHIERRCGKNAHHVLEAAFKGCARALRDAMAVEGDAVPSTKGVL